MSVYLLWLIQHVAEIHQLSLGYLIFFCFFWTFCKERTKATGFAVEVIVLPTVKINMYTDIDIFKEDINTFLWNDKEGNKEKRTLGNLRDVIEMTEKAVVDTPKLGMGAKGRADVPQYQVII